MPCWTQTHYQHDGAGGAQITLVNNEHDGLWAQGVVQRDRYHGVGVTGQLADNPLPGSHAAKRRQLDVAQATATPSFLNATPLPQVCSEQRCQ